MNVDGNPHYVAGDLPETVIYGSSGNSGNVTNNTGSQINFTWYGVEIYVSSADVNHFSTETAISSFIAGFSNTGIPHLNAILQSFAFVTGAMSIAAQWYDNGNGFSIICPLYVPAYIKSH